MTCFYIDNSCVMPAGFGNSVSLFFRGAIRKPTFSFCDYFYFVISKLQDVTRSG